MKGGNQNVEEELKKGMQNYVEDRLKKNPIIDKINKTSITGLDDLKKANEQFQEKIEDIKNTSAESIPKELLEQANTFKETFKEMIPNFNEANETLTKNLKDLLDKVDNLQSKNLDANKEPKLGDIKAKNEWEADNAALVVITKDMILTQLYMNYLKYFKSILVLIRDNVLPNYNDIQQAKKDNKEIIEQLEAVLNDPEIQEKWNTVLKTIAIQSSRFIFIVTMFSDILLQKLGDVGNRFIVEFVNQNSDAILRIVTNILKGIPFVGSGVASADGLFNTISSILNLGLIGSYSLVDGVRIPADAILRGKAFEELANTKEQTQKGVNDLIENVNNTRNKVKEQQEERKEEQEEQPIPPIPDQGSAAPAEVPPPSKTQQGNAKKKKQSKKPKRSKKANQFKKKKQSKKQKRSKKKKQSKRKKKKKTQKRKHKK